MFSTRVHSWRVLLIPAALAGCSDGTGPAALASSVTIEAPVPDMPVGASVQLNARVLDRDGAVLPDAAVRWSSSNREVAEVGSSGLLTALAPGETTIRATVGGASGTLEMIVWSECISSDGAVPISPGSTHAGTLSNASCIMPYNGMPAAPLAITVSERTRLRIAVDAAFPPLAFLTDRELNLVAYGASGDGGGAASITAELAAGSYVVWVSTLSYSLGAFRVSLVQQPLASCSRSALALGSQATGSLRDSSCLLDVLRQGHFTEAWDFTLAERTTLRADLRSTDFDALLVVTDGSGEVVGHDDDGGQGSDARLIITLPPGSYTAWPTSWAPGSTGSYSIGLTAVSVCGGATAGSVAPGSTVSGTLATDACILLDGPAAEGWSVSLAALTRLRLRVRNAAFPPVVAITNANGQLLTWAPPGAPSATSLLAELPAGDYVVWVGTFEDASGSYELVVEEAPIPQCELSGTLVMGQTVSGTITESGCTLPRYPAHHANAWQLVMGQRGSVQVDLASTDFDAVLLVMDSSGTVVALDDDGGEGTNSRVRVTLDAGSYTVWATTFYPGATGAYQLGVRVTSGGGAGGMPSPSPGRVFDRGSWDVKRDFGTWEAGGVKRDLGGGR